MTRLAVYDASNAQRLDTSAEFETIANTLHKAGVLLERWRTRAPLGDEADPAQIIEAYRPSIDRLITEYGFQSVDVVALTPDHPDKTALRQKFLEEHTHADFEVRFFVKGQGLFYIHPDNRVLAVLCQAGDLISIPAGTKHWFDMGSEPAFQCIRLFSDAQGWVAQYTGDPLARRFPTFDQFVSE